MAKGIATISGLRRFREKFQRDENAYKDVSRQFAVRRFAGPISHAEKIDHIRIAHITDMHVGRVTPMSVQHEAVSIVNDGQPDAVVITGDFVCHCQAYLDALTEVIASIDAPVFCVLGNHDHWAGGNEVRRALLRGNAEVLDNANTTIELRRQRLQIVGLDDAYTGHASWEQASKGLRKDLPTLGLSHIGEEADALWSKGVPLVLSGHTHAGQITVARLHELSVGKLAGYRYVHGLYGTREKAAMPDGCVYVGAGVGAAVVPLRVGERAMREVTFFELGHAPGSFDEHHEEQPAQKGRKPSEKTKERRAKYVARKRKKTNGENA